jgi:3-dehydroquinate synthase
MTALTINHALGSYPVHVESGILVLLRELLGAALPNRPLVLIADETVDRLYDEWTSGTPEARQLGARASDAGVRPRFAARLTFPAGEASKTRETWQRLTDAMLAAHLGRDAAIVAIGGGVTADLAGFVAATYLRGIPHVQVPTTLVAMVDAAVGGKVGVDTTAGKNLVGAFYPPALVVADPLTLMSLPEAEYRMGLAEAVKHGLIADREYFEWLGTNGRAIRSRQPGIVTQLVRRSIEIKASIVSEDERERGRRAILNAGHSVAHALEQVSAWQLAHGEAVSIGLVVECRIAEQLGVAEAGLAQSISAALQRFGLPVGVPSRLSREEILAAMQHDKKNRDGTIQLALPRSLGSMHERQGAWTVPVEPQVILAAMDQPGAHIST